MIFSSGYRYVPICQYCGKNWPIRGTESGSFMDRHPLLMVPVCLATVIFGIVPCIFAVTETVLSWVMGEQPTLLASIEATGRAILHLLRTIA